MSSGRYERVGLAMVLSLVTVVAVTANPTGTKSQANFGSAFFDTSVPCPFFDFPTFEVAAPIPSLIDPFEQDIIPIRCQLQVRNNNLGIRGVNGKFKSTLLVLDNRTGQAESFPVAQRRFNTDKNGFAQFDFELPTELFADGFESGDVSAWSYTRTDFSRQPKRKGNAASFACGANNDTP